MAGTKGRSGRPKPAEPFIATQIRLPASLDARVRALVAAEAAAWAAQGHSVSVASVLARVVREWALAQPDPPAPAG